MIAKRCLLVLAMAGTAVFASLVQTPHAAFASRSEHAASWPGRMTSVLVAPPQGANRPAIASLYAVTCPPRGGCVAVGDYQMPNELTRPMAVVRASGHWRTATSIQAPVTADPTAYASLSAVACADVADCVAVGNFTGPPHGSTTGNESPMAVFLSHGTWQRAIPIELPRNALASLGILGLAGAVACQRDGDCTIVGEYSTRTGSQRAYQARAALGTTTLSRATELPFSPLLGTGAEDMSLSGLSCESATTCVAVGSVSTGDGSTYVAVIESEVAGEWAAPAVAPLPPGMTTTSADTSLESVACTGASACIAIGVVQQLQGSGAPPVLVDTLSAGRWLWARTPKDPGSSMGLGDVSCASSVTCWAAGYLSGAHGDVALLARGSVSGLTEYRSIPLPNGGPGPANYFALDSVSCTAAPSCTVVGSEGVRAEHT